MNTTSTAVELRFDVARSPSLPEPVKARLRTLAGRRMTLEGVVVIRADRHRSQERNRDDARERLMALLREAATPRRLRRPTKPTLGSKQRRLASKSLRSGIKASRQKGARSDEA